MQVHNIRVSFLREKQPVQYEKAQPFVEMSATLDDNEDHIAAVRRLLSEAATAVYNGLGYDLPDNIAKKLLAGETSPGNVITNVTNNAAPAETEAADSEIPGEEKPSKKRGRPAGSKNKAAKATEAAPESDIPGDEGIPGDDDKPQISTNPENRTNPDDDIPGDEEATAAAVNTEAEDFTAKDLHGLMNDNIKARKLTVQQAKTVMAEFKVARAQDLTPEQVALAHIQINQYLKQNEG